MRHTLQSLLFLALVSAVAGQDYTKSGPCTIEQRTADVQLPAETGCGSHCSLSLILHLPIATNVSSSCSPAPHPVIAFFNGFELRAEYYFPYSQRLATWGHAVVQYTLGTLPLVADAVEVRYLEPILQQLEQQTGDADSPLFGRLDPQRVATIGHSRGAKLAALHLAQHPWVATAFLLDPVDSSGGDEEPSAVVALQGLGRRAGVTGAGVGGPCNPSDRNYSHFWEVLGPGSWLEVVPGAGHMQFAAVGSWVVREALDAVCHSGPAGHSRAVELAAAPMVAWMDAVFASGGGFPVRATLGVRGGERAAVSGAVAGRDVDGGGGGCGGGGGSGRGSIRRGSGCHRGGQVSLPARRLASRPLAEVQRLEPGRGVHASRLDAFFHWVEGEEAAGEITFVVK